MLQKSIIVSVNFVHFVRKMSTPIEKKFYFRKLSVHSALISVFFCLLLLVFNFFPHSIFSLLLVVLESTVFFLFLVIYYFCFDWDEIM